jgi:hypothetical protein
MYAPISIAQEIDQLQNTIDKLKKIQKLYPLTVINDKGNYETFGVNKEANSIVFSYNKNIVWAYVSKTTDDIHIYTTPAKFGVLIYDPQSLYTKLIIDDYRENMKKWDISEKMIRKTDLYVIEFMKKSRRIPLKDTNLDTLKNDNLKKLLVLL